MHKDVGNISRNLNYRTQKQYFKSAGFNLLELDAIYFETIPDGVAFLRKNHGLQVQSKTTSSCTGQTVEFPYAPGALGIYATLLNGVNAFTHLDSEYLLILEDDLEIIEGFKETLNFILSQAPAKWDVLNLFEDPDGQKPIKQVLFSLTKAVIRNYSTSISACYILNRESSQKILNDLDQKGIRTNLDWYLFNGNFMGISNLPNFNTHQVNPFLPRFCTLIANYKKSTILTD